MGRIIQLEDHTINQIAAGEVVERPASVVKELVENALDADAKRIFVSLREGGRDLIEVLDDGIGMDEEDAILSIKRHSTSKLKAAEGLSQITTMGFRGEALASIAAVSHFELLTCHDEIRGGMRICVDGGGQPNMARAGFPRGSKIRVEKLFFNTPARRKFLRAAKTELRRVQDILVNLALPHWQIHLRLANHDRMLIDWPPASSLGERVLQVFGKHMRGQLLPIECEDGHIRAVGLVSHPTHPKASRRWQHLFINQRSVKAPAIQFSLEQAFRTLLMHGRYPAFILLLHLPSEEVDVNVHPAKSEVRLRNTRLVQSVLTTEVHRQVERQVREQALTITSHDPHTNQHLSDSNAQPLPMEGRLAGRAHNVPFSSPHPSPHPSLNAAQAKAPLGPLSKTTPHPWNNDTFHFQPLPAASQSPGAPLLSDHQAQIQPSSKTGQHASQPNVLPQAQAHISVNQTLIPLCQFHLTYILAQRGPTLLLIDQHAAHERIVFETLRAQLYGKGVQTQPLLIPFNLDLSPQNAMLLEQHLERFQKMGFAFEVFGPNSFLLRETPRVFGTRNVGDLVLETLDELAMFGKSGRVEEALNDILERTACHSAIRAGDQLSNDKMQALLEHLETLDISFYCPHGRPIWVEISAHELEKRFKRIP